MKAVVLSVCISLMLVGCGRKEEVASVSLGLLTTKDIQVEVMQDPQVPGVTCHISNIVADLDWSDPSDMSIACRQTGEITPQMLASIDRSDSGEVVFKKSKSILFKSLKIRRIFDPQSQTLMYLSYSTKEINGSYKHALSTVPLWGTAAYQPELANSP